MQMKKVKVKGFGKEVIIISRSKRFPRILTPPDIPRTFDVRSKVFKNWDGSDEGVVTRRTNPSKFHEDFASGKSHSARLLLCAIHILKSQSTPRAFIWFLPKCFRLFHSSILWLTQAIPVLASFIILEDPIKIWISFETAQHSWIVWHDLKHC